MIDNIMGSKVYYFHIFFLFFFRGLIAALDPPAGGPRAKISGRCGWGDQHPGQAQSHETSRASNASAARPLGPGRPNSQPWRVRTGTPRAAAARAWLSPRARLHARIRAAKFTSGRDLIWQHCRFGRQRASSRHGHHRAWPAPLSRRRQPLQRSASHPPSTGQGR